VHHLASIENPCFPVFAHVGLVITRQQIALESCPNPGESLVVSIEKKLKRFGSERFVGEVKIGAGSCFFRLCQRSFGPNYKRQFCVSLK